MKMKIGRINFEPKIEKNVPLTRTKGGECWIEIYDKMNDGDSFLIPLKILANYNDWHYLRQIIIKAGWREGIKITTRMIKGKGLRIWKNINMGDKANEDD